MHVRRLLLPFCWTLYLSGCDAGRVSKPEASPTLYALGSTTANTEESEWYPTNPDGTPDLNANAEGAFDFAEASITWGDIVIGKIRTGFWYHATGGELTIFPQATRNDGEEVTINPRPPLKFGGCAIACLATRTWEDIIPGAVCKTTLSGFGSLRVWFAANAVTWGNRVYTVPVPLVTAGGACLSPSVMITPYGTINVTAGTAQTYSVAAELAGTGSIESRVWSLNDDVVGSGPSITMALPPGSHVMTLEVTNSVRKTARASVSINSITPPPGNQGGGNPDDDEDYVTCYTLEIDHYEWNPNTGQIVRLGTDSYSWCEGGDAT